MLLLNILNLIKNKTISIKYTIHPLNYKYKNYYIYNNFHKNIIELLTLLNSLSIVYLFIHKYISFNQKFLLITNNYQHYNTLKSIAILTSNYYITNALYPGIFTNWKLFKKKLILYKWLEYFFFINLNLKNKYINISSVYHNLYIYYLKLKLKYNGIKQLYILPKSLLILSLKNNKNFKELFNLNKNIIFITNKKFIKKLPFNVLEIVTKNINYTIIYFILKIITTAILHGILF